MKFQLKPKGAPMPPMNAPAPKGKKGKPKFALKSKASASDAAQFAMNPRMPLY